MRFLFTIFLFLSTTLVANAMIVYGEDNDANDVDYNNASVAETSVASISGCSCVYLGDGWFITANHVSVSVGSTVSINGDWATVSYVYSTFSSENDDVDLVLFYVEDYSSLESITSVSLSTAIYNRINTRSTITFVSAGRGRDSDSGIYDLSVDWGTSATAKMRSQTDTFEVITDEVLVVFSTDDEGSVSLVTGDSGSGAFVDFNGDTYLLGIAVGVNYANTTIFGDITTTDDEYDISYSVWVSLETYVDSINEIISTVPVPEPSTYALIFASVALGIAFYRKVQG